MEIDKLKEYLKVLSHGSIKSYDTDTDELVIQFQGDVGTIDKGEIEIKFEEVKY